MIIKSHRKTFQEMYVNVGMANREKRPKQEREDIRFTHTVTPTSFYIFHYNNIVGVLKCVFRFCGNT